MNSELQKIDTALTSVFSKYTFANLSEDSNGTPLVSDTNQAYCFDEISNSYFRINHCSCDCLLLREKLYLIEFKRLAYSSNRKKYKILKQNLALKIAESLHTIEKKIFDELNIDTTQFEKIFVCVVDSRRSPITAMSAAMSGLSGGTASSTFLHSDSSLLQSISKYGITDWNGSYTYFHGTKIINEANFSSEIAALL